MIFIPIQSAINYIWPYLIHHIFILFIVFSIGKKKNKIA